MAGTDRALYQSPPELSRVVRTRLDLGQHEAVGVIGVKEAGQRSCSARSSRDWD